MLTGAIYLLALLAVGVLMGIAYWQGKNQAGAEWRDAVLVRQRLEQENAAARQQIDSLKAALEFERARANREIQINRQAFDEVSQTLLQTSREISSLKEDLRFYESVIQAESQGRGLQVRALRISTMDHPGRYAYHLIIIDGAYGRKKKRGTARITIHGIQNGKPDVVKVSDESGKTALALHFKYFQRLDGSIELPEHFQPRRIQVKVAMRGARAFRIEKWYDWPLLVAGEEREVRQSRDQTNSGVE